MNRRYVAVALAVLITHFSGVLSPLYADLSTGLVAYYPFNGNANDASGNGHDGIVYGAFLAADRFGNPNACYGFAGSGNWIRANIGPSYFASDFAISVWVNFSDFANSYPMIISGDTYYVHCHGLGPVYGSNYQKVTYYGGSVGEIISSNTFAINRWYHLCITRQGSNTTMYVNGVFSGQDIHAPIAQTTGSYLQFGNDFNFGSSNFHGLLDDIRIYNRGLSLSEVVQLYNTETGNSGPWIIAQPSGQFAQVGSNVVFSVSASGAPPLGYQWRLNGQPLAGATHASLSLSNVQLGNAGGYSVIVSNIYGSVSSAAAQLILLMQTNRQATVAEIGQSGVDRNSQLQVYTNGTFQSGWPLNTNRMTIVLTHGWNSHPSDWPAAMAALFVLGSRTPTPNIVAWNWTNDAASDLLHIYVPVGNIPKQGDALGKALLAQLGPNYSQPIHFIGHSFGTLVNARAADYLHGDGPRTPAKGANAFLPANTQMTLFDEAELAPDSLNEAISLTLAMITGVSVQVNVFYGSAMPKQSRWADNYVSAVGLLHPDAANVIFTKDLPGLEPNFSAWWDAEWVFHGDPYGWYDLTVPVCSAALMGNQWSFEQSGFGSAPATGSVFVQTVGVSPLDLAPTNMLSGNKLLAIRFGEEAASLAIAGGETLVVDPIVQVIGQVTGSVGSDLSSLYMLLQTVPSGGLLGPNGLPPIFPKDGGSGGGTNAPACAWIPLAVPSNAVSMSFNFMVQGNGQDDSFAVAVGGTNVLSLAMSLIQTNVTLSSGLIGVSPWVGQTVELFLGIVGGTSTNASLTVEAITFYGVVPPSLQAQASGSNLVITWPVSANGYALESCTSLIGTNSWAPVTNVPAIVDSQYTVTNAISAGSRFYRLNKAP
jgi:pimeloyl-ACP methyl ester carboxylesterase